MSNTNDFEAKQMLSKIIEYAVSGEHTNYEQIANWENYKFYKKKYKSTKIVIKVLRRAAKRLFKKHCLLVQQGSSDATSLIAYNQLLRTTDFYKKDLEFISDVIYDYEEYLAKNNRFIWALLGEQRKIYKDETQNEEI